MKRLFKVIVWLAIFDIAISLLTGCSSNTTGASESIAVVAGNVKYGIACDFTLNDINSAVKLTTMNGGNVSITKINGDDPKILVNSPMKAIPSDYTDEKIDRLANERYLNLCNAFKKVNLDAKKEEVDILKAIRVANTTFPESGSKTMVVLSNGISTCGYLNFTKNLLKANENDIIAALKEKHALPDLSGVNIVWIGIGQMTGSHKELSPAQVLKLKSIWSKVIIEAGGSVIFRDTIVKSSANQENLPKVSQIETEDQTINVDYKEPETTPSIKLEEPSTEAPATIILGSSKVNFKPDSAEFVDEKAAMASIREVASKLLANPSIKIHIVGTTATGEINYTKELSQKRVEVVKKVLISLGLDSSRIVSVNGLGCTDPWHVDDLRGGKDLVEPYASANRKVLIIPVGSPDEALIK